MKNNNQIVKSGGPKTDEGKSRSKYNAVRHGILRKLFVPAEAKEAELLHKQLMAELNPETILEELLIEMMTTSFIRRARVYQAERDNYFNSSYDVKPTRYLVATERQFYYALHELQRIQAIRNGLRQTSMAIDLIGENQET
jgi:hypothetical protein